MFTRAVHIACQAWFAAAMLVGLTIDYVGCVVIHAVVNEPLEAQGLCCKLNYHIFKWFLIKACPWIQVTPPPIEEVVRLLDREKVCLLMNHTSFFDSVLFAGTIPADVIWRYRTLLKSSLLELPLLGGICRMVGHFPVYFTTKDRDSFTVNKVEQAKVSEKVKAFVDAKGSLCLYPEAKVNSNPAVLCSFRRGSFSVVEEKGMSVVTLTTVGTSDVWPIDQIIGGLPAKVTMKLTEVVGPAHGMSGATILEKAYEAMKADLGCLLEGRNGSKAKGC